MISRLVEGVACDATQIESLQLISTGPLGESAGAVKIGLMATSPINVRPSLGLPGSTEGEGKCRGGDEELAELGRVGLQLGVESLHSAEMLELNPIRVMARAINFAAHRTMKLETPNGERKTISPFLSRLYFTQSAWLQFRSSTRAASSAVNSERFVTDLLQLSQCLRKVPPTIFSHDS